MKISKTTIDVLKNFSTINQNIFVHAGSELHTRTVAKTVLASAKVDTVFPQDFGIYNLSQFLGILSLFSDPDIEMSETSMTISQGANRVQYTFASEAVLEYPDVAFINKVSGIVTDAAQFELSEENLKSLMKAGAVLSSTDLCISGDGDKITCTTMVPGNSSVNTFSVDVGATDRIFNAYIKLETLKLPSGAYTVSLSPKKLTKFVAKDGEYTMMVSNTSASKWD